MGRRKGSAVAGTKHKAASSSAAQGLLQRQGMQSGFIGFSSSRIAGGGIAELDANVRVALRKVTKKDITTKLKAYADLLALLEPMEASSLLPCLQPWVSVFNGIPLEHDRRVRMAGLHVQELIVKGLGKQLAPELKNMFGSWAMLMHDRHKECRELAVAVFEEVFPANKRQATWLFCKEQLVRTVSEILEHQPETLCDMRKVTPAQAQDVWVQAVVACLGSASVLLGFLSETDQIAAEHTTLSELYGQAFWKLFSHKVAHVRRAAYIALTGLLEHAPLIVEGRKEKTAGNVLTAFRDEDQYACTAMVPLVTQFFLAFPDSADNLKASQLRQARASLSSFFENSAYGAALSCYGEVPRMLSALPVPVTSPKPKFYEHVLLNLWAGRESKFAQSSAARLKILQTYCQCAALAVQAAEEGTCTEEQESTLVASLAVPFLSLLSSPSGQLLESSDALNSFATEISGASQKYLGALLGIVSQHAVKCLSEQLGSNGLQDAREVSQFLCVFQDQTGITVVTKAALAAVFRTDGNGELPSSGLLVCAAALVCAYGRNEASLPCPSEELMSKFYVPWLKVVSSENSRELELVCTCAVTFFQKELSSGVLVSRMTEEDSKEAWYSAMDAVMSKEGNVACVAALLKAVTGVSHDNRLLQCQALDALALQVASGQRLSTLSGRVLLDLVLSGGPEGTLPLLCETKSEEVAIAVQERLESFAKEDPDEAKYSRAAMQAIVNAVLVTNALLKSPFFALQLPLVVRRCMVNVFRLRTCTKFYWKQLRLDASAQVVFDPNLPVDTSGSEEKDRSPVSLLANGVWDKRAEAFVEELRESSNGAEQFIVELVDSVHWCLSHRGSAWFNAELDAWQAATIWKLACESQSVMSLIVRCAEEWKRARALQPYWELVDRNKEPLTGAINAKDSGKDKVSRSSVEMFAYPRMIRFLLHLCITVGDSSVVLGLSDSEEVQLRPWLVRELCTAYVLARDAMIAPLGKGGDWHDEWGIAVELLLEQGDVSLFSQLRLLQEVQERRVMVYSVLRELTDVINGQSEDTAVEGESEALLAAYALALFIHTLVSADEERAEYVWKTWLHDQVQRALEYKEALPSASLWLLEAVMPEVVASLPPLRLRELGLIDIQERAIEKLCGLSAEKEAASQVLSVLCHALHTPLVCPTPASEDLGAQLSCTLMWLSESHSWTEEITAESVPFYLNAIRLLKSIVGRNDGVKALSDADQMPQVLRLCESVLNGCLWNCTGHLLLMRSCIVLFRYLASLGDAIACCEAEVESCLVPMLRLFLSCESAALECPTVTHLLSLLSRTVAKWIPSREALLSKEIGDDGRVILFRHLSSRNLEVQKAACILLAACIRLDGPLDESSLPIGADAMEMKESLLPSLLEQYLLATNATMAVRDEALEEEAEDSQCPYAFRDQLQKKVETLLVWSLAMDFIFIQELAVSRVVSRWLARTELIDSFLDYFFRLVRNNSSSITPAEILSISALDAEDEQSQLRFLAELYLRVLETVPALVRSWWSLCRDRRLTTEVEDFTSEYISPVLVQKELQACANHEIEEYAEFEIKSNFRSRSVTAVFTEDDANTEVVLSLPASYPLRPVKVECEHAKDVFRLRVWLAQDATLLKAVIMWMKYMENLFDGIESCLICYSVYHDSKRTLPNLTCKTCKNKFHSACLYKWFNTSHKSNCPLCQTPWMD